jgi:hypothetical protein
MALTPCEFGLCDGSGFLIDEDEVTARDCRCRPMRIAASRSKMLEAPGATARSPSTTAM